MHEGKACPTYYMHKSIKSYIHYYSDAIDDRRWEFQCASGGGVANVTSNCTLQVCSAHIIVTYIITIIIFNEKSLVFV